MMEFRSPSDIDPEAYAQALDEVYALRRILAYEADTIAAHIDYKTFPKGRRRLAEQQIERMRGCARGESQIQYGGVYHQYMRESMRRAGAKETLTRTEFEEEVGIRPRTGGSI